MTFGPQSSAAVEQTATELMARRRRNICEGLLRDLLDPKLEVDDEDYARDSERYFMLWLANRALTTVTHAEVMLAAAPSGACPPSGTGAGGGDNGVPEPAEIPARSVVVARSHAPHRGMSGSLTLVRGWLRLLAMSRPLADLHEFRLHVIVALLTGKGVSRRAIHSPALPMEGTRYHLKSRMADFFTHERWSRLSGRSEIAQPGNSVQISTRLPAPRVEGDAPQVPAQRGAEGRRQDAEPPAWPTISQPVLFRRMATVPG
jgi:hypothetical protein